MVLLLWIVFGHVPAAMAVVSQRMSVPANMAASTTSPDPLPEAPSEYLLSESCPDQVPMETLVYDPSTGGASHIKVASSTGFLLNKKAVVAASRAIHTEKKQMHGSSGQ
jgi:hypothetical protein